MQQPLFILKTLTNSRKDIMKKQELTKEEQMVLSYLALINIYVEQNSISENEVKKSLGSEFAHIFDDLDTDNEHLFYENLIKLDKKGYIELEDDTYWLENNDEFELEFEEDIVYCFEVTAISTKGMEYIKKHIKINKKKLQARMRNIQKLESEDIEDICKRINSNEILKFISALVAFAVSIVSLYKILKTW